MSVATPLRAALLALLLCSSPRAFATEPTFEAVLGLDGWHRTGRWCFAVLHARNAGPPVRCVASVLVPGERTEFARAFELAGNASLRLEIPFLPEGELSHVLLRVLRADDGTALWAAETPVPDRRMPENMVLVVGRGAATVVQPFLVEERSLRAPTLAVRAVESRALPEDGRGLDGVQAVMLAGLEDGTLSPAQAGALASWVSHGGTLVFVWSPGWHVDRTIAAALAAPVEVHGSRTLGREEALRESPGLPLPEGGVPLADFRLEPGAELVPSFGSLALVARRRHGLGSVVFVGADLARTPFAGWAGSPVLLRRALATTLSPADHPDHENWFPADEDQALRASLSREIGITWISPWWLVLFTFVYALLVGPGTWVRFRRRRKGIFAVVSLPALVLGASALALVLSRGMVAGETLVRMLSRVDVPAQGGPARARTFGMILVGENLGVELVAAQDDARLAVPPSEYRAGGTWSAPAGGWSDVRVRARADGHDARVGLTTRTWTAEYFSADWTMGDEPPVAARLVRGPAGDALEVENRTGGPLVFAFLLDGGRVADLPDLPSGQSTQAIPSRERMPVDHRLAQAAWSDRSWPDSREPGLGWARGILDLTLRGPTEAPGPAWRYADRKPGNALALHVPSRGEDGALVLLAWSADVTPPVRAAGVDGSARCRTLFRVEVSPP